MVNKTALTIKSNHPDDHIILYGPKKKGNRMSPFLYLKNSTYLNRSLTVSPIQHPTVALCPSLAPLINPSLLSGNEP